MNIKQSVLALGLSAVMLLPSLTMTACNKKNEPVKTKPTNVYRTETLYETTYKYNSETFTGRTEINGVQGVGDSVIMTGYSYDENWNYTEVFWRVDPETGSMTDIAIPSLEDDDGYRSSIRFASDGSVWYTVNSGSYDEETGNYTENLYLYHASADGTVLASADLYEAFGITDRTTTYLYINDLEIVGNRPVVATEEMGLTILSEDLTSVQTIEIKNMRNVYKILPGETSILICYYTDQDWTQAVVSYDIAAGTTSEPLSISSAAANYLYNAMPSDSYDFVYSTNIGIYGYDIATDTQTELLNWVNSDINASYINGTYIAPNGIVYALLQQWKSESSTTSLLKMTRIPDEEVKEKYMLTYGTIGAWGDILDAIVAFNRQSEDYRITVRDYSGYNSEENEWKGAVTQFNTDITTGNIPDIIALSSDMPFQNYAAKGLFANLRPLMEADSSIDMTDIYENILEAFSVDGKLYQIAPSFSLRTLAAKSSLVGEEDGWSMDDLLAAMQALSEGADPFGGEMTRETFLTNVCSMARDQFIDKDSGTCSFNSPEFIKILEFAASLPEKSIWETTNWDEVGEDFYKNRDYMFRENRALLAEIYLGNYTSLWETQEGRFGERISLVGYPNANRQGNCIMPDQSFAVSAQTQCPEGAWAFISSFLNQSKEGEADSMYAFSIFRSVNAKMAEYALAYTDRYWQDKYDTGVIAEDDIAVEEPVEAETESPDTQTVDENDAVDINGDGIIDAADDVPAAEEPVDVGGNVREEYVWPYWIGQETIDLGRMSEDAVAHLDAVIGSVSQLYQYDEAVMNIILEEASAYFSGQKTASEVASLIQNRVFIVVNESR